MTKNERSLIAAGKKIINAGERMAKAKGPTTLQKASDAFASASTNFMALAKKTVEDQN